MRDNNSIEIANIKNMVYKMMNNKKYGVRPNILVDDDNSIEGYQEIDNKVNELNNFINLEDLNLNKIYTFAYDLRPKLYLALLESNYIEEVRLKEHCFFEYKYIDVVIHSKFKRDSIIKDNYGN